jgi:hypothetical protein
LVARVPDLSGDGLGTRLVDVVVVTAAGVETPSYKVRIID